MVRIIVGALVGLVGVTSFPLRPKPAQRACGEAEVRATLDSLFVRWTRGDTAWVQAIFSHDTARPLIFFNYGREVQTKTMAEIAAAVRRTRPEPGAHVDRVMINGSLDEGNFLSVGPIQVEVPGKGIRIGKSGYLCSARQFERLTFGDPQ